MDFHVNNYSIQGMPTLKAYFREIVEAIKKDERFNKEVFLEFLESVLEDDSCPLSWDDAIIIRKNAQ
ncbi:MAG: hypothetical protein ACXADB_05975 [Candidatus Hermodarchaeia archaeon]